MRRLGMGLVVLGSFALTAEADNFHAVLNSNGVMASFDGVTSDGCVHTSGVFFTSSSSEGDLGMLIATSTDKCIEGGPKTGSHIGWGNVAMKSNGLGSATTSGTIEAWDYQAQLAPLTFELSLAFQGTGPADTRQIHYVSHSGGVTVNFDSSRARSANVSGTMTVDGGKVTLTDARLGSGTSGDINVVH